MNVDLPTDAASSAAAPRILTPDQVREAMAAMPPLEARYRAYYEKHVLPALFGDPSVFSRRTSLFAYVTLIEPPFALDPFIPWLRTTLIADCPEWSAYVRDNTITHQLRFGADYQEIIALRLVQIILSEQPLHGQ